MDHSELFESVRDAVGRGVKLTLRRKVQLEVKGDKVENKVLALASHRAFLLSARIPSKVEQSLSYLDIQGIHSNKARQVVLECERGPWTLRLSSLEDVDEVITHIGFCLLRICPAMKLIKKVSVKPPERAAALCAVWEQQDSLDLGPCGGFSHQYRCVCEHLNLPYRDEVQWDVDTIYLSQDTRELNLQDFSHLDSRDLVAIVGVLEFNQWFTKLVSKDVKLSTEVCEQILRVLSRSDRLEELVLDNAGLRSDFAHKMSLALSHNPASSLHTLILSNNALEDKGVCALSGQLTKLATGLKQLNLSRNSLSPKGINFLCQALCANPSMATTLTHLELSGNSLRGDDLQNLHSFLSHDNHLQRLDLSCSDCSLEQTSASLLKGCLKRLSVLNMSKTVFSHRKCKEVPPSFKQFFSSSLALTAVNVSGTRLPAEALKALLLGLGCNPNLSDVSLDLSSCELRSSGSQILEGCIAEIPNISSLDISDNGLDGDLSTLLVWLAKNRSVRHLSLGRNFQNIKSKNVAPVLDNLVHMIQEEESPLTSLSLADSKLKGELTIVLNALGSNASLTKLDISGNAMGDMGAKMLAKALQINTKLRTLIWDRNNTSPQGLQEVASALEKNFTIRFMPIPIVDAAQALKTNPEKTEDALLKMEHFLLRNHETRKYLQEQAYRLQQGIVTSTTQQMVDTMCVKVQDHLNSLMFSQNHVVQDDMKVAENLMKDARNSKTLLPSLYHVKGGALHGAIQDKLEALAGEVAATMDDELQMMLASMLDTAECLCPHVIKRSGLRQELLRAGAERMVVPCSFVTATLLEQSGVDIVNKISEVKLSAASFVSDRIVDEILDSLSTWQHTLAEHVTRKGQPALRPESQETEVLDETVLHPESIEEEGDRHLEDADTCMMTAKSKRKSILVRMLRPISVAFEMEFDLDKALEEVPIHVVDQPPSQLEKMSLPSSVPAVEERPPLEHQTLQHHTKVRPRVKKRNKPSRAAHATASSAPEGAEHQGIMAKLDEGVEEFFSKNIMKVNFKRPIAQVTPSSTQEAPEKKRESRRSGFFNLIKSRTSRSEKSHGMASVSPPPPVSPTFAPPLSSVNKELPPMSPVAPHVDHSYSDTDTSPPSAGVAEEEEESEDNVETDHPAIPRHLGIPVMAFDLLAEMKARQEKMAAQKSSSREDGHVDAAQPGPVAAPRSNAPPIIPKPAPPQLCKPLLEEQEVCCTDVLLECSTSEALKGPIPAPRLKRAPSAPEPECQDGGADEVLGSSEEVLDLPASRCGPGGGDTAWSSLKRCARPPSRCEDERERAKSLPTDARNPQASYGRRASEEEAPRSADNQSEATPDDGVRQV
ncbi:F-actin-uncapping protein LRRC16A-like isoform X2 [Dunckerocampus dactyliophorus]|uniref:F-actin-uncapping protein LRRC16A-like isoform X2 n=1 Tax=Dunckerocampus dactyliophorus TaxID=161453 RepID=UPI0024064D25|nr:F-actin-uncapping protein LRRC16A-like isoform X2 [Dunckerocampus dactyliophorus]